jgi:predicted aldo/keto reductase-like oxidoreductase
MEDIIIQAATLGVMIISFLAGKYIFPNMPASVTDKLQDLAMWADKFVVWAREFMQSSTGAEKMDKVVEQLKAIADEAGLKVTEEQLKAIAQAAYGSMKAGEKESRAETTEAQTMPTIIINTNTAPQEEIMAPLDQEDGGNK